MKFRLALLCSNLLLVISAYAGDMSEFSAYYQASTNGISGNAERHLIKLDDDRYRLNISLEAKMAGVSIGDLEQVSEFSVDAGQIKPQHYSYQLSGVKRESHAISFNWDANIALSTENEQSWTIALNDDALDQLSYQQALALAISEQPLKSSSELSFELVDGGVLETQRFRVLGHEVLATPMGKFDSVKLERIRDDNSGRSTTIWLASDWDYLLAKIEQISSSGLRIELALENALVAGEQVTPLP